MKISFLIIACCVGSYLYSQTQPLRHIPASVDFADTMQSWDGFGFNYVETCQTRDYEAYRQDYGGFSLLSEERQQEIIELVFGADGLDVDIIKMFLDPWHQTAPNGSFDHERTQSRMLYFAKEGTKLKQAAGKELEVITTLYGPPSWATLQDSIGGRDFKPEMRDPLINYMLDWCVYLKEQDLNVRYLSIHNEGEDFYRWNFDDGTQRLERFDYNMYWPPELVNDIVIATAREIANEGLDFLAVTNGEPSNWTRFYNWGYATALAGSDALQQIGILTTHGFINGDFNKLSYANGNGTTTRMLREERPDLRAWITSMSWGDMDTEFTKMIWEHIYTAQVNAIIPWAGIQDPEEWIGGDPNPGTAIVVRKDGTYEVKTGYYLYKQLTQAGHRGMAVARTMLANPQANIIAFAGADSGYPDAFVVTSNVFIWGLPFEIEVNGSKYGRFEAYRTMTNGSEQYELIGTFDVVDGKILYDAPRGSVTTFIGIE